MQPEPPARFAWRDWAEGSVVFDRRLGHTHSLNLQTALVLRTMLAEPHATASELHAFIGQQLPDNTSHAQIASAVDEAREHLSAHGLV